MGQDTPAWCLRVLWAPPADLYHFKTITHISPPQTP